MARPKTAIEEAAEAASEAATRVLRALTRGQPDAVDFVPDMAAVVVERVLRQLGAGVEIRDVQAYAKQSARRVFVDWHRRRALSERFRPMDSAPMTPASLVVLHDDQRRHAAAIQETLAGMSTLDHAVVILRAQGLSSADIAEELGYKSAAVVDTKLTRIRRKLEHDLPMSLIGQWLE